MDNEFDSGPPMLSDAPGYAMFLAGVGEQDNVSRSEYSRREVLSPSQMRKQLCQTYLQHIDPIYRIIHRPSLCAFLLDGKPYLDYGPDHPAPAALACAVYYMGACCLSEQQCTEMFRTSKDTLVSIHQKETDAALQRADFITSNDLTVLQAFVLSLVSDLSPSTPIAVGGTRC